MDKQWRARLFEIQLPGMMFVTISEWYPFTKWLLKTGQDKRNSLLGLVKGVCKRCPQPLNRGDCLIKVKIVVIRGHFGNFDNWLLNMVLLYTGPAVLKFLCVCFSLQLASWSRWSRILNLPGICRRASLRCTVKWVATNIFRSFCSGDQKYL